MLSLSSSIVFSWLGLTWFGCLSSSVAHSIICRCTNYQMELLCLHKSNVLFISFTILLEKNQKTKKTFWKNAKGKKKRKGKKWTELHIFLHCFHCLFVFWEKCFLWLPWTAASWGTASRAMTKGVEGRKNPVISKRGRCAQTVRKGRDIKVEGGGELVGGQILQGRIKEAHKREMATKADSGN